LKSHRYFAHFALFVANLIYALNYGWAKDVMEGGYVPAFTFILLRGIGGVSLFWLVSLFIAEKVEKKDLIRLGVCGFFGIAANQLMFFSGLELTSTIHASIIMVSSPIIVSILALFILKERVNSKKVIGITIGLAGALLIITHKETENNNYGFLGDALIFLNATSYGLYLVLVKPIMHKYHPITVLKWIFTFGFIVIIPFGLSEIETVNWIMPNHIMLKIGFVILFTTFFCYLLNIYGVKHVSPTIVSSYIYLQPILTAFIALMSGREEINNIVIVSSILIFIGVYLVSASPVKKTN
jgi:drug/metabolite transporter (DMT)-like permease